MGTRGPQTHERETVRRFSTAANPWVVHEEDDKPRPRVPDPTIPEQHMGRRGRTLVIHARPNHPLSSTLSTPSLMSPAPSPIPSSTSPGFTLQELLPQLVDTPEEKREAFQGAFLLLHPLFVASSSFLELLGTLYRQQSSVSGKMKVVQLIQKWLTLYPEDYVDMKMRFRLRAKVLENIQALGTEASPLKEELRSTLRLSEQAHATIRPPSYYVEQSVKQIEATHPKETVSQQLNRSRSMMIKDLPDLLPLSPASPLARLKSYARLTTSTPPVVVSEVKHVEPLMSPIVERPMGSIHETLKAQHYDPFSDTLHHRDEDDAPDEADPSKFSSPFSPRPLKISEPRTHGGRHWKGSEFLFDLSPAKICAAFTVMDHINLKAIKLRELSNKQWTRPDALTRAPNVVAMVEQYNARSYWVAAEILVLRDQAQRVKAIRFFIELAQECANARNYFSVFSIIHGLNQSPLFRLQADWEKIPKSSKACLSNLKATITEPSNNFKVYKAIKHQALIPHLAYYTKLCFVYDELSLYVGPEQKINWEKKVMAIFNVLNEFQSCQKQAITINQDPPLLELLGRLTHAVHSAATAIKFDSMWTLSYLYLPKKGRDANVIPIEKKTNVD